MTFWYIFLSAPNLKKVLQILVNDALGNGVDVLQSVDAALERRKSRQFDDTLELADFFHSGSNLGDHHAHLIKDKIVKDLRRDKATLLVTTTTSL